jgi:hypothetical protein
MNKKVLEEVNARAPFDCERRLLLNDHKCQGRITREHAVYYAGKQIDEPWAIVLLCEWAHSVGEWMDKGGLDKQINEWVVVNRMTIEDEDRYPKVNWNQKRSYLNGIFGKPKFSTG